MGHVPPGSLPQEGTGAHLPRRQRGGAGAPRVQSARHRRRLGAFGEAVALGFLRRRGATLVAANHRSGRGEIDLLVRVDGRVVAVEVKTRIGVDPVTQLTDEKLRRMVAAARAIRPRPRRIDLVTVRLDDTGVVIRWVRGAA